MCCGMFLGSSIVLSWGHVSILFHHIFPFMAIVDMFDEMIANMFLCLTFISFVLHRFVAAFSGDCDGRF